jgi:hypothetical protein
MKRFIDPPVAAAEKGEMNRQDARDAKGEPKNSYDSLCEPGAPGVLAVFSVSFGLFQEPARSDESRAPQP